MQLVLLIFVNNQIKSSRPCAIIMSAKLKYLLNSHLPGTFIIGSTAYPMMNFIFNRMQTSWRSSLIRSCVFIEDPFMRRIAS